MFVYISRTSPYLITAMHRNSKHSDFWPNSIFLQGRTCNIGSGHHRIPYSIAAVQRHTLVTQQEDRNDRRSATTRNNCSGLLNRQIHSPTSTLFRNRHTWSVPYRKTGRLLTAPPVVFIPVSSSSSVTFCNGDNDNTTLVLTDTEANFF